jgi:polyhydroxyalkanoate synthesis regulator phasin
VSNDDFAPTMPKNRERLVERLDHMVQSGQVTAEEASELRSATNAADYDAAVVRVRARHAQARFDAAIVAGQMTQAEASANMERILKGEHPRSLRAHLRKIAPKDRN